MSMIPRIRNDSPRFFYRAAHEKAHGELQETEFGSYCGPQPFMTGLINFAISVGANEL